MDTTTTFSDVIGLNINSRNIEYDRSEAPLHCDIEVLVKARLVCTEFSTLTYRKSVTLTLLL